MGIRTWSRLFLAASTVAATLFVVGASASDTVFLVDSTFDLPDMSVGDGICSSTNGRCTLRAAVQEASALDSDARVLLSPLANDCYSVDSTLSVTGNLTIERSLAQEYPGVVSSICGDRCNEGKSIYAHMYEAIK